jgi:hypothetical protein
MPHRPTSRRKPTWGTLGECMRALPNDKWRAFVYHYVTGEPGHGALTAACRAAGFGKRSTPTNLAKLAWHMSHDARFIAAVAEETRKVVRVGAPEAANALINMVRDPAHRSHCQATLALLDRTDPVIGRSHTSVDVVHKIVDPDQEALEELRALRALNTPREKLLEIYGHNGLDRIESLEAAEISRRALSAKLIEGRVVEPELEPSHGQ